MPVILSLRRLSSMAPRNYIARAATRKIHSDSEASSSGDMEEMLVIVISIAIHTLHA